MWDFFFFQLLGVGEISAEKLKMSIFTTFVNYENTLFSDVFADVDVLVCSDDQNNYYYGTSGEFDSNLDEATINDLKIYLNDGSRIVGKKGFKKGKIDLIDKGVYSPCESKINIGNLICPIWQVDG